jgi:hypothetical protein
MNLAACFLYKYIRITFRALLRGRSFGPSDLRWVSSQPKFISKMYLTKLHAAKVMRKSSKGLLMVLDRGVWHSL